MTDINWVDAMSVGIAEFDEAHKGYISALKAITAALEAGRTGEAERHCAALQALAREHGRREEAFLRRARYPRIQFIVETQVATQAKIAALLDAIRRDVAEARRLADDMEMAVVTYLLCGDINFKSFVQNMADNGLSIDPSDPKDG